MQPTNNTFASMVVAPIQPASAPMTALAPNATPFPFSATAAQLNAALEASDMPVQAQQQQHQQQFPTTSRPLSERITYPYYPFAPVYGISDEYEPASESESEDNGAPLPATGPGTTNTTPDEEETSSDEDPYRPQSTDSDDSDASDKCIGTVSKAVRLATEEAVAEAAGADTTDRDEQHTWAGVGSFVGWLGGYRVEMPENED